ncbi:MAG: DNA-directed RNA polymerase subunit alpha [Patescibacteria group bacterium]
MEKIGLPRIEEQKVKENESKFVIEPLYPGYGPTIGNSLRRVLLSSIIGTAVTYFRVEGISHEFSAIPGVKEDVVELLMNIKQLNLRSHSDEPVTLELSKKGPGEVAAADFKPNSQVEVVDPSQHLVSLDKNASFNLEIVVERDRGFRPAGSGNQKMEIGWIAVDAAFSPVERVSYEVEDTRVGQMTNFDKLTLDIVTSGAVTSLDSLKESARILVDHFGSIIADSEYAPELTVRPEEAAGEELVEAGELEDEKELTSENKVKIEDAGFSPRTTNALINAGVRTIAGLKRLSQLKLEEVKGLGKKGIAEVNEAMKEYE